MILDMSIKMAACGNGKFNVTVNFMDTNGHCSASLTFTGRGLRSSFKAIARAYETEWARQDSGIRSAKATDQPYATQELQFLDE